MGCGPIFFWAAHLKWMSHCTIGPKGTEPLRWPLGFLYLLTQRRNRGSLGIAVVASTPIPKEPKSTSCE